MSLAPERVWVVIPAYNEEKTIAGVIEGLLKLGFSILVVDDGSTDKTYEIVKRYPVASLHHVINLGQGAALETGFEFLRRNPVADYVVTFDADGQHDPADIIRLVECCATEGVDIALGTRFAAGSKVSDMPWLKRMTLKLGIVITKVFSGLDLTDTHNGIRAFKSVLLNQIRLSQRGMAHASEILNIIGKHHIPYQEVPVSIAYTEYSKLKGQSILNSLNIMWDLLMGYLR